LGLLVFISIDLVPIENVVVAVLYPSFSATIL